MCHSDDVLYVFRPTWEYVGTCPVGYLASPLMYLGCNKGQWGWTPKYVSYVVLQGVI